MAEKLTFRMNWLDRVVGAISPARGLKRMRDRACLELARRHFEAAQWGRRTAGWRRTSADSNATNRPALVVLREHARDLERNNGWAKNSLRIISRNVVSWGMTPKALEVSPELAKTIGSTWRRWAGTTECDADGRRTFAGLQRQIVRSMAKDGESLIRRRWRRESDGLTIPMQLQVLEADFIDTNKDGVPGLYGGTIVQGIEYDAIGRRAAYWLFDQHPGSAYGYSGTSRRIPASEILHVFDAERPGQVRGISWFAPAIVKLKDFDEYEDGTLMRQKIAALFSAFVTNPNGEPDPQLAGTGPSEGDGKDSQVQDMEPGIIMHLAPGEDVEFADPPTVTGDGFSERTLRGVAAALGVTYEELTGDWSNVNYSSGRLGRNGAWGNVWDWQWNILVPLFCDPAWAWAVEAMQMAGVVPASEAPLADWTAPPVPMIDPEKEGLAYMRRVRAGQMTPDEMVREQGRDPDAFWEEYAANMRRLDELGITIDSDARKVTQAGLAQAAPRTSSTAAE